MFTGAFNLRDSSSMILPISRVAHSMTYSLTSSDTLSLPNFLTSISRKFLSSSDAAKVMRWSFLPEKSKLICIKQPPLKGVIANKLKYANIKSRALSGERTVNYYLLPFFRSALFHSIKKRFNAFNICSEPYVSRKPESAIESEFLFTFMCFARTAWLPFLVYPFFAIRMWHCCLSLVKLFIGEI